MATKADATLVNLALKESVADIPKFNTEATIKSMALPGMVTDALSSMIQGEIDEYKAENKKQNDLKDAVMDKFTKDADRINLYLSKYERGGKEAAMHEQIYNNTFDYIEELKSEYEQYNTVGDDDTSENKKKRMEILGKLNSAKDEVVALRSYVLGIAKLGGDANGGSALSKTNINTVDLFVMDEVINMDGDYKNVKQRWDKDKNEMIFDVTLPDEFFNKLTPEEQKKGRVRTMSAREMKEKFDDALIPEEIESQLLEQRNKYISAAQKGVTNFGPLQDAADKTADILGNNKSAASYVFMNRQDGEPSQGFPAPGGSTEKWKKGSWANALEAHPALNGKYKVYGTTVEHDISASTKQEVIDDLIKTGQISKSDVDTDGKDGVSAGEYEAFMVGANRDKVIDALVNHKNPAYDHELSVKEYSNWKAKLNKARFDQNQKPKSSSGRPGKEMVFGMVADDTQFTIQDNRGASNYIRGRDIANTVETYKNIMAQGSGVFSPYDGEVYKYENNNWFRRQKDDSYKQTKPISIYSNLKWDTNPQIMKYLGGAISESKTNVLDKAIAQPEIPASLKDLNRKKVEIANDQSLSNEEKQAKIKELEELYKKQK